MTTRISRTAVAASVTGVLASLSLLTACGGATSTPQNSTSASAAQSTAPGVDASVAPTSAGASSAPVPVPSSTSAPSDDTEAVKDASEKFVTTVLTIGYPDKTTKAYLDRIEPLTTESGFATVKKQAEAADLDKAITTATAAKVRSHPKIKSVEITSVDASSAEANVEYTIDTQQRSGDGYKTTKTGDSETVGLTLENQGGKWLVDTAQ